ncbi:DUF2789 domain-containing protein [Shewanella sp. 10N.261.52.F9]|uniref:DUF2789 domain-containing protein n=1 Tax=Shewanella TaxID=22 RepID=UPI00200C22A2|nr:DUF2789 domain-containing protein [Shewanella marinintestina]MCL1147122.1 DUF2789 domain-containing protein [Shewanella marinintestina]
MDTTPQDLSHLFLQLGLADDHSAIEQFINDHQLANDILLHKAPFWTASQKHFLEESFNEDAQWTEVIDHLDTLLRKANSNTSNN